MYSTSVALGQRGISTSVALASIEERRSSVTTPITKLIVQKGLSTQRSVEIGGNRMTHTV